MEQLSTGIVFAELVPTPPSAVPDAQMEGDDVLQDCSAAPVTGACQGGGAGRLHAASQGHGDAYGSEVLLEATQSHEEQDAD